MADAPGRQTWPTLLSQLIRGEDLAAADAAWAMDQVMSGTATNAQIAGFAVALAAKGETAAEVDEIATMMLAHAQTFTVPGRAVDIVGTGGDRSGTVNISTMASLVVAASGAPVIKHGARAASSQCGTADVLEELGVAISLPADAVRRCVEEVGIGFCFAPTFHPATRHAGPIRRELGVPTVFNFLGPLTNPAQPSAGLVGCANARIAPVLADVFARRGGNVLVVRGDDGLDEITTTTTTTAWLATGGTVTRQVIDPVELGVAPARPADLLGGDRTVNAQAVRDLLAGKPGPVRDAVLVNAAGALAAFQEFPSGSLARDLGDSLARAGEAIDSGKAAELLGRWARLSTSLAG